MVVTPCLFRWGVIVVNLDLELAIWSPLRDLSRAGDLDVNLRVVGTVQSVVEGIQIRSSDDVAQVCRLECVVSLFSQGLMKIVLTSLESKVNGSGARLGPDQNGVPPSVVCSRLVSLHHQREPFPTHMVLRQTVQ